MGGSALVATAQNLLAAFRTAAGPRLSVDPEQLQIAEGIATAPDGRQLGLAQIAAEEPLNVDGTFANSKATYTYGTAAAHVAVDPGTGQAEVLDYTVVDDVGRIINPETLHGQVVGAAVQGLGATFGEHLQYDSEGQLLVGSLADYQVALAEDYPNIHAVSLELYPSPNNPLGAKGAGEGGIIPVGGVLANAVASALRALDVQPNELPLTPPRIWALINNAERLADGTKA
jgi:carbon-monoxide dehydrogenase large subunit